MSNRKMLNIKNKKQKRMARAEPLSPLSLNQFWFAWSLRLLRCLSLCGHIPCFPGERMPLGSKESWVIVSQANIQIAPYLLRQYKPSESQQTYGTRGH